MEFICPIGNVRIRNNADAKDREARIYTKISFNSS